MPIRLAIFIISSVVLGFFLCWRATHRPEESNGRTVVTYMTWGDPNQRNLEWEVAQEFMRQNPDIEIRLAHVPGSAYLMKQNVMLASRTAPDVMRVDHYYFPALVKKGYFLPLEPIIKEWKPDLDLQSYLGEFVPVAIEEGRHEGRLYGMNMLFGARVLYFNKTMFEEAGMPDPYTLWQRGEWTIDQFLESCRKLTTFDEKGKNLTFGAKLTTYWPFLWSLGGEVLDSKLEKATIDSPHTVEGLEFHAALVRNKLAPDSQLDKDPIFQFESGRIAMVLNWAGEAVRLKGMNVAFDWDIAPVPRGPGGQFTTAKGNQLVITRNCKHPIAAWRWIEFLVSEPCERKMYVERRRGVPTRKKILENEYSIPDADGKPPHHPHVFYESVVKYGRSLPINDRWMEWETAMNTQLDGLWLGTKTASEAAKDAQKAVTEILTRNDY